MSGEIFVIKSNGEREIFSEQKVLRSMRRVGVSKELENIVLQKVKEKLYQNIKTSEIFSEISEFLRKKVPKASFRFNLKQAIFDFGPSGFPFEKYIAKIFEGQGYRTQTDIILKGDCVDHEVDILIEKDGRREMVEAKFHNQPGVRTDIHVALYTYARFLDVKEKNGINSVWIITNTKLSQDSIRYAECKNIKVIGWNYPEAHNLQDFVENPQMYPITILNSLGEEDKRKLFESNIVLCSELVSLVEPHVKGLFIDSHRFKNAQEDAKIILGDLQNKEVISAESKDLQFA